jgi:hypothetical protein
MPRPALLARLAAASAGLTLAAPAPAAGQRARCDSVLAAPTADSVTHTVSLTAAAFDTAQGIPPSLLALVGQGVAQAFVPPQPLAMLVYQVVPTPASMAPQGYPVVNGDYVAVLHRDGRLTSAAVLASSLDAAFDRAVLAAVARVDSIGFRFPPPDAMDGDSAFVRLRVDPYGVRDGGSAPMFRARVPRRTFTEALVPGAGGPPAVPYTLEAIAAGAKGMVTTWFVVDTAGVPVARSLQVLRADHPQLLRMVQAALPTVRYQRTHVAGCGVPVHLVERFDFAGYRGKGAVASAPGAPLPTAQTMPRRLDTGRLELRYDAGMGAAQSSPGGRPATVVTVEVVIDEQGMPDMSTLRATGPAAASNRNAIEQWVGAGKWEPGRDAAGNAVRAKWVYVRSAAVRVQRIPT